MTLPTLPQAFVDTTMPIQGGTTHVCDDATEFSTALTNAALGDIIELTAGNTFAGPFTLPNKMSGSGWIVIRSSLHSNLPEGTRVGPVDVSNMATITGNGSPVTAIDTVATAHHFRFIGIDLKPASGTFTSSLIRIGNGDETTDAELPHHIIFDRCYIHGDPTTGGRRGIYGHANHFGLIDSYLSMWAEVGGDAQCFASTNGAGPFKIVNNYLEGAAENIIFGGRDARIPNLVCSDITIQRNHFFKPLSWYPLHGTYAGTQWQTKNLLETKNAQRVLIDGNLFENNWEGAESGMAIWLRSNNQEGNAPWSTSQDITFTNNIIRNVAGGMDIAGDASFNGVVAARRILVKNNLWLIDTVAMGGQGKFSTVKNGAIDITIDHNTCPETGWGMLDSSDWGATGLVWTNNIVAHDNNGVKGASFGVGNATLAEYYPGAVFTKNVIVDADDFGYGSTDYPANNFFPSELSNVGFVNLAGGNYRLDPSSAYYQAGTDGLDIGANIDAIDAAISGQSKRVLIRR